ncbi:MAG: DNA-directed RNA polymerase subunit B [Candidatus Woesearchaeota archaeon]|nr:MAG: DNA-directed RNA polymerase subunit B [Candidatus Woesearchaeota archaeon]
MTDVFYDDKFVGNVDNPQQFVEQVKEQRRSSKLPKALNVYYDDLYNEVYISTTTGRAQRPLIVVRGGKSLFTEDLAQKLRNNEITWGYLVEQGVIEYLDAAEEENALTTLSEEELTPEHTHLEISPILLLGLVSSLVPYGNHTNPVRLEMGTKVYKQALGIYTSNYLQRYDTDCSLLYYPQIPILQSFMYDILDYAKHPSGQNVVIAVMSYEGYNMQDSIIINKGSIDRGFGRSTYYRPYIAEELRYSGGLVDEVGIPDKEVKAYRTEADYRYLEKDGIIYPEADVKADEALIGKTSPPRFLGEVEEFSIAASTRRESSVVVRHGEEGKVDMVVLTENEEGNKLVQVRLRDERIPEIGDKFASRHGQKGVVGMIVPEADMPVTSTGIKPDIIFSPHSLPSRMTVNHILEVLASKVGALSGKYIDGTCFDATPEEELRKQLLTLGFREDGAETMYNGITGELMKVRVYIGNMYYLKLQHMAANRLHARASGRIQLLTRQPIEGRAKGGGLRLGEMEKDCLVAHGAALLLKERFDSDKVIVHVCEKCGTLAIYDEYRKKQFCQKCGTGTDITPIELSYAFKLLLDEMRALNVYPKLILESKY